jgi:acyl carrier protein
MKQQQSDAAGQTESWLTALVAQSLEISASQLDAKTHFSRYGLDSVSAVSILTAISNMTGLVIADDALLEYPTISQLAQHIRGRSSKTYDAASAPGGHTNLHTLLQQDSILPADIQPPQGEVAATPTAILLTGATGFLGIHLLDVLMRNTKAHIYCLIRSSKGLKPSERLAIALSEYGIELQNLGHRVTVLAGDICEPQLGLPNNVPRGILQGEPIPDVARLFSRRSSPTCRD